MPEQEGYSASPVEEAGQFVCGRFKVWNASMRSQRDRWSSLEKRYNNYKDDRPGAHATKVRANLGIPLASQTIDTTMARIVQDLLRRTPYGRYRPTDPVNELAAGQMQKVVDYQQRITDFKREAKKVIKDALWAGTGHAKLIYDVRSQVLPVPKTVDLPVFGPVRIGTEKKRVKVMESPRLVSISPFDCFYPIDAPHVNVMEGFIHRTWQTARDLRSHVDGVGRPLYDPEDIQAVQNAKASVDKDQQAKQSDTTHGVESSHTGLHKSDKLEFLEYIGKLPEKIAFALIQQYYPEDDPDGDWIVSIVEGSNTPLRVEPSPHQTLDRPIFLCKINESTGRVVGVGILERVEKLGQLIDGLYSNIVDNMNIINNRPIYVNKAAGMKKQGIVFGPGKVFEPAAAIIISNSFRVM